MTMPIAAISSVTPISSATAPAAVDATASSSGTGFASALSKGMDAMTNVQNNADNLAVQAATGQLVDPAALTTALTQAQLMTQLATTVQSKAVAAFNTIMGMQA